MPSYDYNKEYAKKYLGKLDELKIRIPKGRKTDVEAHAKSKGESINGLVNALLMADMGLSEEEWKKTTDDNNKPDS